MSVPGDALRRLPLNSLRVFVAVAEHLHFTRAASSLGVTVSAVSMQVRLLEQYLGVALFERRGQRLELSAQGAALVPKVRSGLAGLQNAIDDARAGKGEGPLRISMLGSFLTQWLMPRLPGFEALHPDIELRIESSTSLVDFTQSDVDAAIRLGAGLSRIEGGLRLRYEIEKEVAPFVGVGFEQFTGATAGFVTNDGEPASKLRLLAGVKVWF